MRVCGAQVAGRFAQRQDPAELCAEIERRLSLPAPEDVGEADAEAKGKVSFDDEHIVRHLPDGWTESIRWDQLRKVSILTTDFGPFADDLYWVMTGDAARLLVPSETAGAKSLLGRLQCLPNFRNESVIEAAGCTDRARWRSRFGFTMPTTTFAASTTKASAQIGPCGRSIRRAPAAMSNSG